MFYKRPHRAKDSVAALVSAYRPRNRRLHLESRESLDMGACFSRDGRRLPSKCGTVRASALLRYRTAIPPRGGFCRTVGIGIVSLHPDLFLIVVFSACCLAICAEIPLGKYRKG